MGQTRPVPLTDNLKGKNLDEEDKDVIKEELLPNGPTEVMAPRRSNRSNKEAMKIDD